MKFGCVGLQGRANGLRLIGCSKIPAKQPARAGSQRVAANTACSVAFGSPGPRAFPACVAS